MRSSNFTIVASLIASFGLAFTGCSEAFSPDDGASTDRKKVDERAQAHDSSATWDELSDETKKQLTEVRKHTADYNDFKKGTADYSKFTIYVPGMGVHYLKDSLVDASSQTMDWNRPHAVGSDAHRNTPGILLYDSDNADDDPDLLAIEYIVPFNQDPPVDMIAGDHDDHAWHPHPSLHEINPADRDNFSSIEGACHYTSGAETLFAVTDDGENVFAVPGAGDIIPGSWDSVDPSECHPEGPFGSPLHVAHGKTWALHAWLWEDNPNGIFAATHPDY